jgi:hypothetical protein
MNTASASLTALGQIGGELTAPRATLLATSMSRPGSKIGMLPPSSARSCLVLVDADHVMAEIGKARAGHQPDIA